MQTNYEINRTGDGCVGGGCGRTCSNVSFHLCYRKSRFPPAPFFQTFCPEKKLEIDKQQECIPVGCVPPAAVAVC